MKKEFATILLLAGITCNVYAQWTGHSSGSDLTSTISRTGMIAIDGYSGPQIRLNSQGTYYGKIGNPSSQVWSLGWGDATTSFNPVLTWAGTNNVGIGTTDPWDKLHVNGTLGIGKFVDGSHSGLKISYDDAATATTFLHQRWGGGYYFKRNGSSGERTQLYFGGFGNHYLDVYNDNNQVNVRLNTGGNSFFNGGNVGIANDDPWEKLHINGTVGIGKFNDSPHAGLKVQYTDGGSGSTVFKHQRWGGDFYFKRNDSSGEKTQLFFGGAGNHYMDIYNNNNEVKIRFNSAGDSYFNGGSLSIGTDNPQGYKLAVNGKTITEEVVVKLYGNWPDYVFESDYKLPSLSELEQYIKTNKHLPDVPTAAEVKENGLSVGEMNAILLKKVEELTLHVIELKKEINDLKK